MGTNLTAGGSRRQASLGAGGRRSSGGFTARPGRTSVTLSPVQSVDVIAQLNITEARDVLAILGTYTPESAPGSLKAVEARDTFSASGTFIPLVSGVLLATEQRDVLAGVGTTGASGVLTATEARDLLAASGLLGYSGELTATEAKDVAVLTGLFSTGSGNGTPVGLLLGITQTSAGPSGTVGQSAGLLLAITRAS